MWLFSQFSFREHVAGSACQGYPVINPTRSQSFITKARLELILSTTVELEVYYLFYRARKKFKSTIKYTDVVDDLEDF